MIRTTHRILALAGASLLLAGPAFAKKKKDKDKDAPAEAAAPAGPETPDDANSKKFGAKLVDTEITDFNATDAVGATFKYSTLSFRADNTWQAAGYVEIADERMECTESGTWRMDPAESATVATVTWTLDQTDCPGREAGGDTRAKITLTKSGIEAVYR